MYYLVYGLFYLLSLLPLRVLFLLSDLAYLIIYKIAGYRKEVVMQNLAVAFPEKSEREREAIARGFYRHFTDTFIETIKLMSASQSFIRKHYYGNLEIFDTLFAAGKKVQAHLGHNFNWEMANSAMSFITPYQLLTVYMPIRSKIIDRLFRAIRTRHGAILLPANKMSTAIIPYRNSQYLLALVADQNPGVPANGYWLNFFGKPTPFVKGPEKGARANDAAVVFVHFTQPRRGYYEAHFELATDDPMSMPETQLTRNYIRFLERVIRQQPDMWLWSHRRWKHEWKPEYGPVLE